MRKERVLRFGIKSLDRLIGSVKLPKSRGKTDKELHGIDLSDPERPTNGKGPRPITSSICLAGPDGTGKSVLSLHLASQYLLDCITDSVDGLRHPKILYISTDLTYEMALKGWNHFSLDRPFERKEPLIELREGTNKKTGVPIRAELKQYFPAQGDEHHQNVIKYIEGDSHAESDARRAEVCFVDLASRTAGDDWGFVHRLLSTLAWPKEGELPHLVILDAVEGFETLVGDLTAFGDESSRRSRIAQVMRLAAGRCHLVLVVEEGVQKRFPEEFVTDVVIRLRNVPTPRYLRRTIEIEKARGQWHRRGQHPYVIRDGVGSTTGDQVNADDPNVLRYQSKEEESQGYVHVFSSLDDISREVMIDRVDPIRRPDKARFAAFGLPYLDNMLGGSGEKAEATLEQFDTRGLPCSSATALIGDSLTQKSQLGRAFLSRTFYSFAKDLQEEIKKKLENELLEKIEKIITDLSSGKKVPGAKKLVEETEAEVSKIKAELLKRTDRMYPVAVLFTTHDLTAEGLAEDFYQRLRDDDCITKGFVASYSSHEQLKRLRRNISDLVKFRGVEPRYRQGKDRLCHRLIEMAVKPLFIEHVKKHTLCRRFEIHDLPGPILVNIFQRGIERAQQIMFRRDLAGDALPNGLDSYRESWRIRVVVDDLNTFRNTYPDMRDDPLMLPSLLFMFGREGVTSLIVDTQSSGSPELSITERFDSSVRELVQTRIYIWRLPFYGENRVAISVIPPMSHEYRGLIRELRWETKNESRTDRALTIDPHFELYTGLERGQPQPVPLEVRLYCDSQSVTRYIESEEKLLREIFTPVPRHDGKIIVPAMLHDYEPLRDACHVQRDTRLDHTTIIQVNEFWWLKRLRQRRAGAFRPQANYLSSATAWRRDNKYQSDSVVDPFWVFQPPPKGGVEDREDIHSPGGDVKHEVKKKFEFFDEDCGYGYQKIETFSDEERHNVDRVPYTWDFGFLLCNGMAWEEATLHAQPNEHKLLVQNTWSKLRKVNVKSEEEEQDQGTPKQEGKHRRRSGHVSWREFLKASKIVAAYESYRTSKQATAFDFTMLIPESFSSLLLEMWLSEAYDSLIRYERSTVDQQTKKNLKRRRDRLEGVGLRHWNLDIKEEVSLLRGLRDEKRFTLQELLDERVKKGEIISFSIELYKVWLLLTEVVDFKSLVDSSSHLEFEFKSKDVTPQAVSARHLYKTASTFIDSLTPEQLQENWIPVRLPGHFSVRADWFLAVAGGSRSSRLADHALDLLSSQRANITRLQEGIGLPTRQLFWKTEQAKIRTRLILAEKGGSLENIDYDVLRQIGASRQSRDEKFFWLWRSGIWGYNRHSRIWHKWLNRALLWWHGWRQRYGSHWTEGFTVYDLLTDVERGKPGSEDKFKDLKLTSWLEFHKLRNILIDELDQVTISRE